MRTKGFTIVELVVVIVLLGILAALALPRFIDVSDDAQLARAESIVGAFRSALGQARAVWQLEGNDGPAENLQVFPVGQDGQIDFNNQGWPSQQWFGALESNPSTNNVADCISLVNALLLESYELSGSVSADIQPSYLGGGRCRYTFAVNAAWQFEYDSNNGEVTQTF